MKVYDELGQQVPIRLWNEFAALKRCKRRLRNLQDRFRELLAVGDFVEDPVPLINQFKELQRAIKEHWPCCICPDHVQKGFCPTCKSKGYLTHKEYAA